MSVFKTKNAVSSAEFSRFGGIDRQVSRSTSASGLAQAYDMVNFKVNRDGSIEKRCGFAPYEKCPDRIRAIWSGELGGGSAVVLLYSNTVAVSSENSLDVIGNIKSYDGEASFIFYDSALYLKDSQAFYLITTNGISEIDGYAPLYAKDWPSASLGEVNEPINIISRHVRMSYIVSEPNIYLRVAHNISSIDAVYVNGVLRTDNSSYYFDSSIMCVCVLNLNVGDKVELYLSLSQDELDAHGVMSCKRAFVYGGPTNSRFFLYDGADPATIYASHEVSDASLLECRKVYTSASPLYVKESSGFAMGKERRKITAVCRHYDRMLIFTNKDCWMIDSPAKDDTLPVAANINSSYGCYSPGAAVMCGNDPICVSERKIVRWTSDTDELNECNAQSISDEIGSCLPDSFFANASLFFDRSDDLLLCSDPSDAEGILWIYDLKQKLWYKYDGIGGEHFTYVKGKIAFTKENTVYVFDESCDHDILRDGTERPINAEFLTATQNFSSSESKKRLCGITAVADIGSDPLHAEFISAGQAIAAINIEKNSIGTDGIKRRLNSKRFSELSLSLCTSGRGKIKVYSLGVWIKK